MQDNKDHKKIIMIGTSPESSGGIASVVKTYKDSGLFDNPKMVYLSTTSDGTKAKKVFMFIKALTFFLYLHMFDSIKLVHIHTASRNSFWRKLFFFFVTHLFNKPYIFHLHGGEFSQFYWNECGTLKKRIISWVLNNAKIIFVLSSQMSEEISKISFNRNIAILPNPIMLPILNEIDKKRNSLLFLGHFNINKGVFDLIEVVALLKTTYPDLVLYLAGKGADKQLKKNIKQLKLDQNIKLLGWVKGGNKEYYLRTSQIFVLPSYAEGLPMSLLEAMSYEMPVVASKVGAIPSVVTHEKEGLLISPGNKDELFGALERLLSDFDLCCRMGKRARRRVEQEFDVALIKEKLAKLYALATNQ